MSHNVVEICVVGSGPRGLSVLERLCALAGERDASRPIRVHVVDPYVHGGGAVWRTDQAPLLLMNTVASQVTMFVDDSVERSGPVVPGPSLYDWAHADPLEGVPAWVRAQARALGPDDYPSRACYGHYLAWVRRHLVRTAPRAIQIVPHVATAVRLRDEPDGRQVVSLSNGVVLHGLDAVILAQGHLPTRPTSTELDLAQRAADAGLYYLSPVNPADADLGAIAPAQPTVLRGLGLTFFDHLALLTEGRGGEFHRAANGKLRYRRSGDEPMLFAGSRRGIPYHARGENQKGPFGRHQPVFLTAKVIADLRDRTENGAPVDFRADVWPLVDREVRAVYYRTLLADRSGPAIAEEFAAEYPLVSPELEPAFLRRFGITRQWDWQAIAEPYHGLRFADAADYRSWLLSYLDDDIREARRGNVDSPLKAALDVMRDLRNEVRLVVDHGGLSGDSYRDDLQSWYTPLNAFVSIGPPVHRIEQLAALIEAGVVEPIGPGMLIRPGKDGFQVSSTLVPSAPVLATALIEARLPEPDLARATDPLLAGLLARGEASRYRIPIRGGGAYRTGGLAVTGRPYHLLDAGGRPHPRRFAFGVPTETVHWVTAAGIRPGVGSVILTDADAIACASVAVAQRHELSRAS